MRSDTKNKILSALSKNAEPLQTAKKVLTQELIMLNKKIAEKKKKTPALNKALSHAQRSVSLTGGRPDKVRIIKNKLKNHLKSLQLLRRMRDKVDSDLYWATQSVSNASDLIQEVKTAFRSEN